MERNNSLEITKQLVKDGKISQEIAQTIFPELAESDDERIRKHIVKFIDETFPRHSEEKTKECEEMLSWLEKQKEQKPAEWSEEDERMLSRCIKSVECSKRFANSETYKAAKDVEMNWLKDLSERFNLQLKQELSEFEKGYMRIVHKMKPEDFNDEGLKIAKEESAKLLELAKEELQEKVIQDYWKQAADRCVQAREEGKAEALKDLPRWNESRGVYSDGWINDGFLYYKNHSIQLSSLEKLPGFKED